MRFTIAWAFFCAAAFTYDPLLLLATLLAHLLIWVALVGGPSAFLEVLNARTQRQLPPRTERPGRRMLVIGAARGLGQACVALARRRGWEVHGADAAPAPALPLAAGAATGALALLYPEILYQGFGNVNALLAADAGEYGPGLLAQLAVAKVAATALCRGGRLVGGLYAPSILVGAALGGAFGSAVGGAGVADPPAYALVGAAAVLARLRAVACLRGRTLPPALRTSSRLSGDLAARLAARRPIPGATHVSTSLRALLAGAVGGLGRRAQTTPADCGAAIIFFVGGVAVADARAVLSAVADAGSALPVSIGGTCLLSPDQVMERVLEGCGEEEGGRDGGGDGGGDGDGDGDGDREGDGDALL
jgi:hypothetical protein